MCQNDHILRALRSGVIHRLLYRVVNGLAGIILQEAVNELSVFILEIGRCGTGQRLRRSHADKAKLLPGQLADHIGLEDQLALVVEVAADIRKVCLFRQLEETLHAVVKLMVAGDGDAVAHVVHQFDQRVALGHRTDRLALDVVAVVHENDVVALGDQIVADLLQSGIAEALVDAAVDIAGIEDDDIAVFLRLRFRGSFRLRRGSGRLCGRRRRLGRGRLCGLRCCLRIRRRAPCRRQQHHGDQEQTQRSSQASFHFISSFFY